MFLRIQNNGNDVVILLYNSDRMCYIVRKKYEGKRKMNRGQTKGAKLRERLIGDKAFYAEVVAVVVPIIIQNTVSNVVSLLDNVMVGRVGTLQMSAVAIVNQLLFVFNLCIFGGLAGRARLLPNQVDDCACDVCVRFGRFSGFSEKAHRNVSGGGNGRCRCSRDTDVQS